MKVLKTLLSVLLVLAAVAAFGWFFLSQLGSGRPDELAAVVVTAPPGYAVVERGEIPAMAAAVLEEQALRPGASKVGVRFEREGAVVYWLADVAGDVLEERTAGPSGTRLQTLWRGGMRARLAWARSQGSFSAPGLPPPERENREHDFPKRIVYELRASGSLAVRIEGDRPEQSEEFVMEPIPCAGSR